MANSITILGVKFTHDGNFNLRIESPGIEPQPDWEAKLCTPNGIYLQVCLNGKLHFGDNGGLWCSNLHLNIERNFNDDFLLSDGLHPQPNGSYIRIGNRERLAGNSTVQFDFGPFTALRPVENFSLFSSEGKLILEAPLPDGKPELPFQFVEGDYGFDIDLTKAEVRLRCESLYFKTRSSKSVLEEPIFQRGHNLTNQVTLPCGQHEGESRCSLQFIPKDNNLPLPLHVTSDCKSTYANMLARNYRITLIVERNGTFPPTVTSILLDGQLECSSLSTPSGHPVTFNLPEVGIHCVARIKSYPPDDDQFSCFLLASEAHGNRNKQLQRVHNQSRIHGPIDGAAYENAHNSVFRCLTEDPDNSENIIGISQELLYRNTLPWLEIYSDGAENPRLIASRPGESYGPLQADGAAAQLWSFSNSMTGVPLLMPETLTPTLIKKPLLESLDNELNQALAGMHMQPASALHENRMKEIPDGADVALKSAFNYAQSLPPSFFSIYGVHTSASAILPGARELTYDFGIVSIKFTLPAGTPPDLLVLWEDDIASIYYNDGSGFSLEDQSNRFSRGGRAKGVISKNKGLPAALVKLTRDKSLDELLKNLKEDSSGRLFDREVIFGEKKLDLVSDVFAPQMRSKEWMGMILFEVPVNYDNFDILKALLGAPKNDNWEESPLKLIYLAISSKPSEQAKFSRSGAIYWRNQNSTPDGYDGTEKEIRFRMESIEMAFDDGRLSVFRSDAQVLFLSSFGKNRNVVTTQPPEIEKNTLRLLGSLNDRTGEISFLGQFNEPFELFGHDNLGPINKATIKSARIVEANGEVSIDLDGTIELQAVAFDGGGGRNTWVGCNSRRLIDFRHLGIHLPKLDNVDLNWRDLHFNYPSINIDLSQDHFKLLDLPSVDLRIQNLGLDWDGKFDWNRMIHFPGTAETITKSFLMGLRLDLTALPDLALGDLKRLQFNLQLGIDIDINGGWTDQLKVAISGVGFEPFRLGLMRFLEVSAKEVNLEIKQVDWDSAETSIPWIFISDGNLKVLGYPLINHLTVFIFALPDGRRGFFGYIQNTEPSTNDFFDINWVLIAQNAALREDLAKIILSPDPINDTKILDKIKELAGERSPGFLPKGPNTESTGEWIFAAGINVLKGLLEGKFLFQDKRYYGIALAGQWLKDCLGYDLAISVLYIQRERHEDDSFYVAATIPAATIGTIRFTGGEVAFEIELDGDFLIDAGFPWLRQGGGRFWDRTLGAIVTPFQGSGGFYLSKRNRHQQQLIALDGPDYLVVSGGYAVQAGLGATFGGGIFVVWVRAGITVVLEGEAAIETGSAGKIAGLKLSGAIGILVEGGGQLRFWIISADITVTASAEARGTLTWGKFYEVEKEAASLQLDFELYAAASASACIGSGWFKVCKGIEQQVSMPYRQTLLLG